MKERPADFTGRLPMDVYRDALDLALVFNQSLSEYLAGAVNAYVDAQLTRPVIRGAVEKVRVARGEQSSARKARPTSQRLVGRGDEG